MWKFERVVRLCALALALVGLSGCAHNELYGAYDCFEENGLMVFGSTGSVDCIDRTTYALRHLDNSSGVAVTDLPDPAALLD